jgi:hypothetical protein
VFGGTTDKCSVVEHVSYGASSDDSGFESTSGRNTTDAAIGSYHPLLQKIEERAQSKTEMKP